MRVTHSLRQSLEASFQVMPKVRFFSSKYQFYIDVLFYVRSITIQIVFLWVCYVPIFGCTILNGKGLSKSQ